MSAKQIVILVLVIVALGFVGNKAFNQYKKFNPPPSPITDDQMYDGEGDGGGDSGPAPKRESSNFGV
jgi:hypothetical protein